MADITVTEVASAIPTIIAARVLDSLFANIILAGIVNRDYDNEVAQHGGTVTVNKRGTLVANDKAANTVVTRQTPSTSGISVALNKHKEVTFLAEDVAIMKARPDFIAGYADDAAMAIAEQVESDIAALYSGFSQTINAAAGLTEAHYREAARLLNSAKAPTANRWAVLHEDAYKEAQGFEKFVNRDYQGDAGMEALKNGYLGMLYGFQTVLSQKIVVATTCKNLFFQRNAMVLVSRPMRRTTSAGVSQATMSKNGFGIRVTMSYDKDLLGEQVTVDALYGTAELRDDHGITTSTTEA